MDHVLEPLNLSRREPEALVPLIPDQFKIQKSVPDTRIKIRTLKLFGDSSVFPNDIVAVYVWDWNSLETGPQWTDNIYGNGRY